jgi:hypothetical protein
MGFLSKAFVADFTSERLFSTVGKGVLPEIATLFEAFVAYFTYEWLASVIVFQYMSTIREACVVYSIL